jgi:hypothetical protein
MKIKQLFYSYFWSDLYYKVRCFFRPKQEWLTDVIPDTYCDKVELIPRLLFKCLEHYVEVERKAEWVHDLGYDWAEEVKQRFVSQSYADEQMKIDKEILKAYDWIKTGRIEIDERIDKAYPNININDMLVKRDDGHYDVSLTKDNERYYDKVNKLEAIKVKKDTEAMRLIVKHHQLLWI